MNYCKEMEFDGDIIITDPCYLDADMKDPPEYFDFDNLENYGIKGIESETLCGDWSCTTYINSNGVESTGEFCADAGMVCVCDLESVLKFNPDFDYHKTRTWTTTWIKNFHGTVQIQVEENKEDSWPKYFVYIVGKGFDKQTGQNISFYTK